MLRVCDVFFFVGEVCWCAGSLDPATLRISHRGKPATVSVFSRHQAKQNAIVVSSQQRCGKATLVRGVVLSKRSTATRGLQGASGFDDVGLMT